MSPWQFANSFWLNFINLHKFLTDICSSQFNLCRWWCLTILRVKHKPLKRKIHENRRWLWTNQWLCLFIHYDNSIEWKTTIEVEDDLVFLTQPSTSISASTKNHLIRSNSLRMTCNQWSTAITKALCPSRANMEPPSLCARKHSM